MTATSERPPSSPPPPSSSSSAPSSSPSLLSMGAHVCVLLLLLSLPTTANAQTQGELTCTACPADPVVHPISLPGCVSAVTALCVSEPTTSFCLTCATAPSYTEVPCPSSFDDWVTANCAATPTSAPATPTSSPTTNSTECTDYPAWIDTDGNDCEAWTNNDWCELTGKNVHGVSPQVACCGCGGGGECTDYPGWIDPNGWGCQEWADNYWCEQDGMDVITSLQGVSAKAACCVCGGGGATSSPTTSPTAAPTTTTGTGANSSFGGDDSLAVNIAYTPSAGIKSMHNIPRVSGGSDFQATNYGYQTGVACTGLFFIIIGFCCLFCFPCVICRAPQADSTGGERSTKCLGISTIFSLAMIVVGAIVASSGNYQVSTATHTMVDSINAVSLLIDTGDVLITEVGAIAYQMDTHTYNVGVSCPSSEVMTRATEFRDTIQELIDSTEAYRSQSDGLTANTISIGESVHNGNSEREFGTLLAIILAWVLSGVYGVLLTIIGCCEGNRSLAKTSICLGKMIAPFTIIVLFLVWITSGLSMMLNVGLSDFCMDPHNNILEELVEMGDNGPNSNTVAYYQTCEGSSAVHQELLRAENAMSFARNDLTLLRTAADDFCDSTVDSDMNSLEDNLLYAEEIHRDALDLVKCERLNALYVDFAVEGPCEHLAPGLLNLWVGCFLIGFFLILGSVLYKKFIARQSFYFERTVDLDH